MELRDVKILEWAFDKIRPDIKGIRFGKKTYSGWSIRPLNLQESGSLYNVDNKLVKLPLYIPEFSVIFDIINSNKDKIKFRRINLYYVPQKVLPSYIYQESGRGVEVDSIADFEIERESEGRVTLCSNLANELGAFLLAKMPNLDDKMSQDQLFRILINSLPNTVKFKVVIEDYQGKVIETEVSLPLH